MESDQQQDIAKEPLDRQDDGFMDTGVLYQGRTCSDCGKQPAAKGARACTECAKGASA